MGPVEPLALLPTTVPILLNTMHSLFTQPEILHLVASYSDPSDWRSLSHVSRSFFESTLALIWWHVEGVHNLIVLLPSADVKALDGLRQSISIRLDTSTSRELDLGRFHIYAPFVRSLEVYGPKSSKYELSGQHLLTCYTKTNVLLPHLNSLRLTTFSYVPRDDRSLWVHPFIAPNLTDIHLVDLSRKYSSLTTHKAINLLSQVTGTVVKLHRLSLPIDWEYTNGLRTIPLSSSVPLRDCLTKLTYLKELTSTDFILNEAVFPAITHLHYLEKLIIECGWSFPSFSRKPRSGLSVDPFPALRHLSFCGIHVPDVFNALSLPGFHHVRALHLTLGEYQVEDGDPWRHELIEEITKACPMLTELAIDFDSKGKYETYYLANRRPTNSPLMAMSKLPLETLSLQSVYLDPSVTPQDLKTAWPLVTRLSMPIVQTTTKTLYTLCQLPKLQELTLYFDQYELDPKIDLEVDPEEVLSMDDFWQCPTGSCSLHTLRGSLMSEIMNFDLKELARVLLHCWPNLQQVVLDAYDPKMINYRYYLRLVRCFQTIDGHIQELREPGS